MYYVQLNNGVKMPQLGLGVWQVTPEDATASVLHAIKSGYRSIDTAAVYKNEEGVGKAIKECGVPREELFITTKVWNADQGYEETLNAFDTSMKKLGLDYLDLYLIHWPVPQFDKFIDTYKALEKLYQEKRIRAIGVSNFQIEHLERLMAECEVKPVLNQIECHPYLTQKPLKEFCETHSIYVESWSPLQSGGQVLNNQVILDLAAKYGKTPAQIILRWHLEENCIVIPKSITPSRIEENFHVFDFKLTKEDVELINSLNKNERTGPDPDTFNQI